MSAMAQHNELTVSSFPVQRNHTEKQNGFKERYLH